MKHHFAMLTVGIWLCGHMFGAETPSALAPGQWSAEKAWAWSIQQPWLVGCNFLPSTAVNDVEMWQKETFDPQTIDRELGWAQELGFNTVRVFVNYVVWEADAAGAQGHLPAVPRHRRQARHLRAGHSARRLLQARAARGQAGRPGAGRAQQPVGAKPRREAAGRPRGLAQAGAVREGHGRRLRAGQARAGLGTLQRAEPPRSPWWKPPSAGLAKPGRRSRSRPPSSATRHMQERIVELSDVLCFHHYGPLPGVKSRGGARCSPTAGRSSAPNGWRARAGSRFETHLPFLQGKQDRLLELGPGGRPHADLFPLGFTQGRAGAEAVAPRHPAR